jgi:hypothetical protein
MLIYKNNYTAEKVSGLVKLHFNIILYPLIYA